MVGFHPNRNQESTCSIVALRNKRPSTLSSEPLRILCMMTSFVYLYKTELLPGCHKHENLFSLSRWNVKSQRRTLSSRLKCDQLLTEMQLNIFHLQSVGLAVACKLTSCCHYTLNKVICNLQKHLKKEDGVWKTSLVCATEKNSNAWQTLYLQLLALLVIQPPEFQLNKISKWWMWQQVDALEKQKWDSRHNTNFKDIPVTFLWKPQKGKTWFGRAIKTTHIPLQHPHPAAHLDQSPSPSPAASFCWEPEKKADVAIFF